LRLSVSLCLFSAFHAQSCHFLIIPDLSFPFFWRLPPFSRFFFLCFLFQRFPRSPLMTPPPRKGSHPLLNFPFTSFLVSSENTPSLRETYLSLALSWGKGPLPLFRPLFFLTKRLVPQPPLFFVTFRWIFHSLECDCCFPVVPPCYSSRCTLFS